MEEIQSPSSWGGRPTFANVSFIWPTFIVSQMSSVHNCTCSLFTHTCTICTPALILYAQLLKPVKISIFLILIDDYLNSNWSTWGFSYEFISSYVILTWSTSTWLPYIFYLLSLISFVNSTDSTWHRDDFTSYVSRWSEQKVMTCSATLLIEYGFWCFVNSNLWVLYQTQMHQLSYEAWVLFASFPPLLFPRSNAFYSSVCDRKCVPKPSAEMLLQ